MLIMVEARNCDNCGKPIAVPLNALNKRFCCEKCRNSYHTARLRKAREHMIALEAKDKIEEL